MNPLDALLDNRYFVGALALVLAAYAGYAAPHLSPAATKVVTSDWFRLLVVFIVAYLPKKNFYLALAIAVGFVATSNTMLHYHVFERFAEEQRREQQ